MVNFHSMQSDLTLTFISRGKNAKNRKPHIITNYRSRMARIPTFRVREPKFSEVLPLIVIDCHSAVHENRNNRIPRAAILHTDDSDRSGVAAGRLSKALS